MIKQYGSADAYRSHVLEQCKASTAKNSGGGTTTETPWGWIIGGIAVLAIGGGVGYYYYSKSKKSNTSGTI